MKTRLVLNMGKPRLIPELELIKSTRCLLDKPIIVGEKVVGRVLDASYLDGELQVLADIDSSISWVTTHETFLPTSVNIHIELEEKP
jgi:hypothetical protein